MHSLLSKGCCRGPTSCSRIAAISPAASHRSAQGVLPHSDDHAVLLLEAPLTYGDVFVLEALAGGRISLPSG